MSNKKNLVTLDTLNESQYLDENGGVVVADRDSAVASRTDTDSFTEISYPNISEVQSRTHHSVSPIQPRTPSLENTSVIDSTDDLFHFNTNKAFKQVRAHYLFFYAPSDVFSLL